MEGILCIFIDVLLRVLFDCFFNWFLYKLGFCCVDDEEELIFLNFLFFFVEEIGFSKVCSF